MTRGHRFIAAKDTYRGSFLARTLASNLRPFLATYSASLSMTGWVSGGGGMMAGVAGVQTGASGFELFFGGEIVQMRETFHQLCST